MNKPFLITGLPRMRSAWLASLFNTRCLTYHDYLVHGSVEDMLNNIKRFKGPVGLVDPSAACVYPEAALAVFRDCPVVVVERDETASRDGLARFMGVEELPNWHHLMRNYRAFCRAVKAKVIKYEDLENFKTVDRLFKHCTGRGLSRQKFDIFTYLKVEQHVDKVKKQLGVAITDEGIVEET